MGYDRDIVQFFSFLHPENKKKLLDKVFDSRIIQDQPLKKPSNQKLDVFLVIEGIEKEGSSTMMFSKNSQYLVYFYDRTIAEMWEKAIEQLSVHFG